MISRQQRISRCITKAILAAPRDQKKRITLLARIFAFFSLLQVPLERYEEEIFSQLRSADCWHLDEQEYRDSFGQAHGGGGGREGSSNGGGKGLTAVGDLGYSGSVFFMTPDGKFLIKSLGRHFEFDHFENGMLRPYAAHMRAHAASSLLVRIMDYLAPPAANEGMTTLGALLGLTPTRYMVMENLLGGKDGDPQRVGDWQSYDLKPHDYFFPERDIADGRLAPDSVKDKLIDKFEDKIRVSKDEYAELRQILESDTALLEATNCVDYSLFLVRYPAELTKCEPVKSNRNGWREGLASSDGKWRYRLVLLDFFFAKHRLQPRVMTALVDVFNLFSKKGPMTITTTPSEYRTRFLKMVDELVEAT